MRKTLGNRLRNLWSILRVTLVGSFFLIGCAPSLTSDFAVALILGCTTEQLIARYTPYGNENVAESFPLHRDIITVDEIIAGGGFRIVLSRPPSFKNLPCQSDDPHLCRLALGTSADQWNGFGSTPTGIFHTVEIHQLGAGGRILPKMVMLFDEVRLRELIPPDGCRSLTYFVRAASRDVEFEEGRLIGRTNKPLLVHGPFFGTLLEAGPIVSRLTVCDPANGPPSVVPEQTGWLDVDGQIHRLWEPFPVPFSVPVVISFNRPMMSANVLIEDRTVGGNESSTIIGGLSIVEKDGLFQTTVGIGIPLGHKFEMHMYGRKAPMDDLTFPLSTVASDGQALDPEYHQTGTVESFGIVRISKPTYSNQDPTIDIDNTGGAFDAVLRFAPDDNNIGQFWTKTIRVLDNTGRTAPARTTNLNLDGFPRPAVGTVQLEMLGSSRRRIDWREFSWTPQAPPVTCPNGKCDPGETCESCPSDCASTCPPSGPKCGNNSCEQGETYEICPQDCAPPSPAPPKIISVTLRSLSNFQTTTTRSQPSGLSAGIPQSSWCPEGLAVGVSESSLEVVWNAENVGSVAVWLLEIASDGSKTKDASPFYAANAPSLNWSNSASPVRLGVTSGLSNKTERVVGIRLAAYPQAGQKGTPAEKDTSIFLLYVPVDPSTAWENYPTQAEYDSANTDGRTAFNLVFTSGKFFEIMGEAEKPSSQEISKFKFQSGNDRLLAIKPRQILPKEEKYFLDKMDMRLSDTVVGLSSFAHVIADTEAATLTFSYGERLGDGSKRDIITESKCLKPDDGIAPTFIIPAYLVSFEASAANDVFRIPEIEFTMSNKSGDRLFNKGTPTESKFRVKSFEATRNELKLGPR